MTIPFKNRSCILLIVIFLGLSSSFSIAQNKVRKTPNIDSIIAVETVDYQTIRSLLWPISRDSAAIAQFYNKASKNNYKYGEAYALNMLGSYCRNTSQYDEAIDYHQHALDLARLSNYIDLEIASLNMLGVVYRRMDAVRSALDYHQEALTIADKITPKTNAIKKSIAVSLNSMGNIYLTLDQFDLAIERFTRSLKIEQEVDNKLGLAINYHNIGYAKEGLGALDVALDYYQKSLFYNTEINSDLGKVICNGSIGKLYIKQNKDKEAIKLLSTTIESAKHLRDKFHLTALYSNLGWAYLKLNNLELAKTNINKSLEIALEYNFKSSLEENYKHLTAIAKKQEDYKNALFYAEQSKSYSDQLTKEKNLQYVNDNIIRYDTEKKSDKIALLEKENEIVTLKFRKNKNILIASIIVFGLGLIITYILYRQRSLNNEKRILTLQQDILRSQMNPHFVFNSLNSIKQYIIANEQKNAVYYLNKFAKLMRKILEASKAKEVSLAEELETLKLYFSIENIRFSNEIVLNTQIDEHIDLNTIKVPSLILQPFVENSIWHGLSSKKGTKRIDLELIKKSEDYIIIHIIDNGIGRERSAQIKENKIIKRRSVGLSLTKDRLTNFVKDYKNKFSLSFVDLKDDHQESLGTKVILELPVR